jgi:nucleotide-binding universal stress UspA family protein
VTAARAEAAKGAEMDTSTHSSAELGREEPFRRVLAAASLDDAGATAVLRAARLPLAPGARLTVLHVRPPRAPPAPAPDARRVLERLAAVAADAARAAGNEAPEIVPVLGEGSAAAEIARTALRERAELVVAGAPSARLDGTARATVARVLREAHLPLLVAKGRAERPYGRVVCGIDRCFTCEDAILLARRLATAPGAALTLVHAWHVPFEPWIESEAGEIRAEAIARVRALAEAVAPRVGPVQVVVRRGEPGTVVLRVALEQGADLLALGTHGRTGLARAMAGSVAEWLVESAPFDVAVARPHRDEPG